MSVAVGRISSAPSTHSWIAWSQGLAGRSTILCPLPDGAGPGQGAGAGLT